MRSQRVLIMGEGQPLARALASALTTSGWRCRLTRPWHGEAITTPGVEDVVLDGLDHDAIRDAMLGCNHAVLLEPRPPASPDDALIATSVRRVRMALSIARDSGVERVLVMSAASTIARVPGEALASEAGVAFPLVHDLFTEARHAVELECLRQAADAMFVSILNPSLIVDDTTPVSIPDDLPDHTPVNAVHAREVWRCIEQAFQHARPGARYLLGGPNTTLGALRDALRTRGQLHSTTSAPLTPDTALLRHAEPLDTTLARTTLGLRVPSHFL